MEEFSKYFDIDKELPYKVEGCYLITEYRHIHTNYFLNLITTRKLNCNSFIFLSPTKDIKFLNEAKNDLLKIILKRNSMSTYLEVLAESAYIISKMYIDDS